MIKVKGDCGRQKRKKKGIHTVLWVAFSLFKSFIKHKGDKYRVRTEQLKDSGRKKKTWFDIYRTSAELG